MKLETFFDNFEVLAEAPNGVKKLREMILELAVRGKLVAQDEKDEPTSILIKKIKAEKERLVKEKKITNARELPAIDEDKIPYNLPKVWQWARLGDICHDWGQKKPDVEFTYIDVSAVDKEHGKISDDVQILKPNEAPSRARKMVSKGTVIYATVRPYLLNIAIVDTEIEPEPIVSTAFAVLHPLSGVLNRYLYYYLRSKPFIAFVESEMTGMAYPAINDGKLYLGLVPLPPSNEQRRIVTKVDQLMSLCDELEARQQKKRETRARLNSAALDRLLAARAPGKFAESWRRISDNFDLIYDAPENVGALKQAILQLAVMGKLVEQDERDEPAYNLLKRIKIKKEQLIKENKIRKIEPLSPINETEIPYILPEGWKWAHFGDLILSITGGGTPSKNNPQFWNGNIPWASVKDLGKSKYLETTIDTITEKGIKNSSTNLIPKGRIIICTRMGLGKISLNKIDVAINQDLKAIELSEEFNENYFYNFYLTQNIKGSGMTVSGIRQSELLNMLVSVPPFNEQHRIVARVDQLMSLCDRLEAGLRRAQADGEKLMEAVVGKILAGE